MEADVIIIGAGAAGLLAAKLLSERGKRIVLLEARNRPGGRMHTITEAPFTQPVETGAEFVHGQLPITLQLLKEARLSTVEASGSIWRSTAGKLVQDEDFIANDEAFTDKLKVLQQDTSVANFMQTHLAAPEYESLRRSLKSYVEGYYAGDTTKASALALKEEWEGSEDEDVRIQGGYSGLTHYLYQCCLQKGCQFHFETIINSVQWAKGAVKVFSADGKTWHARQLIVTVPVGVLQSNSEKGSLQFEPGLPEKMAAAQKLGFGSVIKIAVEMTTPFWKEEKGIEDLCFLFSEEAIPTWWTQHPGQSNLLTGWCAGPAAAGFKHISNEDLIDKAISSLAHCFNLSVDEIQQKIVAAQVFNWAADPFTRGGYSYTTVDGNHAMAQLAEPVEDTLYFAGEGLHAGPEIGTVEAAFSSAQKVVEQITKG